MTGFDRELDDEAWTRAFVALAEPGSLGPELSDDQLLAETFGELRRGALDLDAAAMFRLRDELGLDELGLDELGLDELDELDELGLDELGLDELGLDEPEPEPELESEPAGAFRARAVILMTVCLSAVASVLVVLAVDGSLRAAVGRVPASEASGPSAAMMEAPTKRVRVAHPGEHHELADDDCRRVGPELELCSSGRASFRVAEGSRTEAIELELESGSVELAGEQAEGSIELSTPVGTIVQDGVGSRFRVSLDRTRGQLDVEVITGRSRSNDSEASGSGLELVRSYASPWTRGGGLEPEPEPEPDLLAPELGDERRARAGRRASKPDPDEGPARTPETLLAAAQRELAAGNHEAARRRYRELVESFPGSAAGSAARVSLGRMLVTKGDYGEALAHFDAYVQGGGDRRPLIQEARYGRVRCLRGLRRDAEAKAAIDEFMERYPNSLHRRKLEGWRATYD